MKKWWKHNKRSVLRNILAASCAIFVFANLKVVCLAEATGKVTAPSVRIRQTPDAASEVVGSSASGKTVTILSQTTDASGYVWYEVHVSENTTGYIRSDLLEVDSSSGTIPTTQTATVSQVEAASQAPTASGAEAVPETGMDAQYATIKVKAATIRSTASTSGGKVASLPENTQVIVSGQTEGTDKTWYYITFTDTNGAEKTGYVRSDLITLGDMVPVEAPPEEQQPEEQQPEAQEPENGGGATSQTGYEAVYELDGTTGEYVWKLYDWEKGEKQNLEDVLAAAHAQSRNDELDADTVAKQRIVIIVLIVVIIILAVAVTIMIFKLRDAYYEAYEDDEEDEEEDEEEEEDEDDRRRSRRREERSGVREGGRREEGTRRERSEGSRREREEGTRRERSEGSRRERDERMTTSKRRRDEDEEPVRRKSSASREERPTTRKRTADSDRRMPSREVSYEDDIEAPVKAAPKKKAKNFLADDDDFEFEFLNMKNKDNDI